ncbi:AHH domain-containing protein [Candidatus Pollutiaquabacter sp.]|uniref:AHH domain-containing protein n=1 Tax=Candidatus Pollutiaquabacter sp. TaxID=3416354 RepID=UPI003C857973|nr:hypothetical protein [Bacteroidota bacterium]
MIMPARDFSSSGYRYGFNKGSEKDNEIAGNGNFYTTHFREYNSRLGIWMTVDPKDDLQPWQSPYCAMNGNPVLFSDPNGDIVPIIFVIWAVAEVAMTAYDAYDTYKTVSDPKSTPAQKTAAVAGFTGGLLLPGGGYGVAAKQTVKVVEKKILKETAETISEQAAKNIERLAAIKKSNFVKSADGAWSANSYRKNLQKYTGKLADGFDAHHTLPKSAEFAAYFKKAGLDVNDPVNMVWREAKEHSTTAIGQAKSKEHLKLWKDFMSGNPKATKEQILKQRDVIEQKIWGNAKGNTPTQ